MSKAGLPSPSLDRCRGRRGGQGTAKGVVPKGSATCCRLCLPSPFWRCSRWKGGGREGAPRAAPAHMGFSRFSPVKSTRFWAYPCPPRPTRPHRDGVFGACVNDGLQQVVKFIHVQLSLLQKLLHLLLHCVGHGRRHLLLEGQARPRLPVSAPPPAPEGPVPHTYSLRPTSEAVTATEGRASRQQSKN